MQQSITGTHCRYKPVKYVTSGGGNPYYEFPIEYTGADIVIDSDSLPVLTALETYMGHDSFLQVFMSELVNANRSLFVKTYTAEKLVKITAHGLGKVDENTGTMWKCVPVKVILNGGKFIIYWDFHTIDVPMIDLGEIESRPASRAASPVPVHEELQDVTSEIQVSRSNDDLKRERERKRVYEARLRAKLAVFTAEKVIQRYIHKYGDDELSDSESDYEDEEEGLSQTGSDAYSG